MTEKRFTVFGEWHKDNVIDEIRDNTGEFVTIGRCVDLLNENEQLKSFIKSLAEQSVNGKVMLRDGKVYDLNKILKKGDVE